LGEEGVGGGEGDVAAPGQFLGVSAVGFAAEADHDLVSDLVVGGMEAQHGREGFLGGDFGDEKIRGDAGAGFGGIGEEALNVGSMIGFLESLRIEGTGLVGAGHGAHDLSHGLEDFLAAVLP
jgi:hypothetical protein